MHEFTHNSSKWRTNVLIFLQENRDRLVGLKSQNGYRDEPFYCYSTLNILIGVRNIF